MMLLSTPFHNQNNISLPYIMASILLHKFKLNIKRCLLNQSDPILCPNNGNISLPYGVSFAGYLQRDTPVCCVKQQKHISLQRNVTFFEQDKFLQVTAAPYQVFIHVIEILGHKLEKLC